MAQEWLFLIHQIPPKPLYLRAKIRTRLGRVGAVALKNSVYVLPRTDETLEDFQWIAEEITSGGGKAWILGGEVLGGIDDHALIEQFHAERASDYAAIRDELERRVRRPTPDRDVVRALSRARDQLGELRAIDFFDSPAGKEIAQFMQSLETKLARTAARREKVLPSVKGKTWVTRAGIKVDRIASSWLIRRYIDPDARFRFVDARRWTKRDDEIGFDIVGGDYSHEADRCTFETLIAKFAIRDRAVAEIAEIVHDIDLKDGKFQRGDAAGIQLLIQGLVASHPEDDKRLERGLALFDDLARSFASPTKPAPLRGAKTSRAVRGK